MNWQSSQDFLAMGGYGLYVWGSYAAVAVCMLIEPFLARSRHKRALRLIAENQTQEPE